MISETTQQIKRYDKYKDSGIEWIGEIPEEWNVTKIGQIYTERNEKVSDKDYAPLSVTKKGIVPQLETAAKTDNGDNRKLVKINDFAINSRSDRRGSCGISEYEGSVSLINTVLAPRTNMSNKFYNFTFKSECFADEFYRWGTGIVDDLWSTKWSSMKNIYIPYPNYKNQQAIAEYLDKKCGEIDEVVEVEKQIIEKLKEYKQSVITEAVTKGLDKTVPLKDSGIEWIGEIPEGWKARKLKTFSTIKGRIGFKGYTVEDLVDEDTFGCAIVLGGTNIMKDGYISFDKLTYINEYKYLESPEIMLHGGEILITKVGAGTGENAIYNYYQDRVTINPNIMLCIPSDIKISKYLNYYLLSDVVKKDIYLESNKSGAQPAINQQFIKNLKIVYPNLQEQQAIAEYLDKKCAEIDEAISKKEQVIEKLTEYKKSLIYECVTGKRKVVK